MHFTLDFVNKCYVILNVINYRLHQIFHYNYMYMNNLSFTMVETQKHAYSIVEENNVTRATDIARTNVFKGCLIIHVQVIRVKMIRNVNCLPHYAIKLFTPFSLPKFVMFAWWHFFDNNLTYFCYKCGIVYLETWFYSVWYMSKYCSFPFFSLKPFNVYIKWI